MLRDWPSLSWGLSNFLWLALVAAGLALARWNGDTEGVWSWLVLGAILAVASAALGGIVLRRVLLIARLLNDGPRLSGRIIRRSENGHDLRQALVAYAVGKRVYQSLIPVAGCPVSFRPLPGDDVAIVIDPRKPTRAFFLQALLM
jgi:hypothetical protein